MNAQEIEAEVSEEEFENYLNELFGVVDVCGYKYDSGHLLKKLDPIAFGCSKSDYEASLDPKWECSDCKETFDMEWEAEECCSKEREAA